MNSKNKSPKKGSVINSSKKIKNLKELEKKHGKLCEMRQYKNGRYGAFFKDGQFRWVGVNEKKTKKLKKSPKKSPRKSRKKCICGSSNCNCNMTGGTNKAIDLKTAVKLLRNYYAEKYN